MWSEAFGHGYSVGMTGSTTWEEWLRECSTVWRATLSSASLPKACPVFGLRSNLGKFDDDISRRTAWPRLKTLPVTPTSIS